MRSLTFWKADAFSQILGPNPLGDIVSGSSDTPVKVGVRNEADEEPSSASIGEVGGSDGISRLRIGADTGTLSSPFGLGVSVSSPGAGGTWGGTGRKRWVVTSLNANGETVASYEISAVITDTTQVATVSWTADAGATGYNVYRKDEGSTYASPSKVADDIGTNTFDDDGTAPSTGSPPTENTTGGAGPTYGTPPTMGLGPVAFASPLKRGQWAFLWVSRVVPSNSTPDNNSRLAAFDFVY